MTSTLRLKGTEHNGELVDLAPYKRTDKRLKEILLLPVPGQADFVTTLEKAKAVAEHVVEEVLKPDFSITTHFVSAEFGKRSSSGTLPPFDLHIIGNFHERSPQRAQKLIPTIMRSVYHIFSTHQKSYKVEEPEQTTSTIQLTDLKSGLKLCLSVVPNHQTPEVWNEVHSIFTTWPFLSLASKCLERVELAGKLAEFLQSLDQFTRDVITLAKIWSWNCQGAETIPNNVILTELVAIKAAQEEAEEKNEGKTLTSALERFWKYMGKDLTEIKICWRREKLRQGSCHRVEDPIHKKDYLKDVSSSQWGIFQARAQQSLFLMADVELGMKSADCLFEQITETKSFFKVMSQHPCVKKLLTVCYYLFLWAIATISGCFVIEFILHL